MIGGDPNGQPFKDWAFEEWRSRYGTKPPWGRIEFVNLASALSRCEDETVARSAWSAFLASTDPFYAGSDPRQFLRFLSRFVAKAPRPKPQKQVEGESVTKAMRMAKIYAEVERDSSVPEAEKKNEAARRCRALE